MVEDTVNIKFKSDDSELDRTGQKIHGFGADINQQFTQAAGGGGISGLFSKITNLGFAAFGLQQTFQAASSVVSSLFGANIEFEGFEARLKVLLGSTDAAKARLEDLAEFGRSTPFELPEVVRASITLETMTKGALSTSEGLTLVGDVASGTGQRIDELAMWFGRLYDGLQSGRPVGEAMMRLQELGAISGDTRAQIEAMQDAGVDGDVVWQTAADSFARFSGTMDEQSKTVGGALSNISDGFGMLKRNIMQGFFEAVKPGIMGFADLLGNKSLQAGAKSFGEAMGSGLGTGVKLLGEGLSIVMPPLIEFAKYIGGEVMDVYKWIVENVPAAAEAVYDFGMKHTLILAFISPVGAAILEVIKHWDELKGLVGKALSFGKDLFGDAKEQFDIFLDSFKGNKFAGMFNDEVIFGKTAAQWGTDARAAVDELSSALSNVQEGLYAMEDDWKVAFGLLLDGDLQGAWDAFVFGFKDFAIGAGIFDEITAGFDSFKEGLSSVAEVVEPAKKVLEPLVKDVFVAFMDALAPITKSIKEELIPAFKDMTPIIDAVQANWLPVLKIVGEVLGVALVAAIAILLVVLKEFFDLLGIVGPIAISILADGIRILTAIITGAVNVIGDIARILQDTIELVKAIVHGDWDKAWQEFKDIFEHAFDGIEHIIEMWWAALKAAFTGWPGKLWDLAMEIIGSVDGGSGFVGAIGGAWNLVRDALWAMWDKARDGIGNAKDWLVGIGWDIIRGLVSGIKDGAEALLHGAISTVTDNVVTDFAKKLKINSPSLVMVPIGEGITEGLAVGVADGIPMLSNAIDDTVTAITDGFVSGFSSGVTDGTNLALEAWQGVLQSGLDTGAELSTDTISQMFADLYQIISDAPLADAGKKAAQDFLSAIINEFGTTGSLANKTVMDFVAGIMNDISSGNNSFGNGYAPTTGATAPQGDVPTGAYGQKLVWDQSHVGPDGKSMPAWVYPWETVAYNTNSGQGWDWQLGGGPGGAPGGKYTSGPMSVTMELDGEKIGEAVISSQDRVM